MSTYITLIMNDGNPYVITNNMKDYFYHKPDAEIINFIRKYWLWWPDLVLDIIFETFFLQELFLFLLS